MKELINQLNTSVKPIVKLVKKTNDSKVIAIGLNEGIKLEKHTAPGKTKMLILQGEVVYKSQNGQTILSAFEEYDIPLDEEHEVTARIPSVFLLLVG